MTLEFGVVYGNTERLADIEKTDLILVPGGSDLTAPMRPEYQAQIRRLAQSAKHITSVCNGSLVLAATGILNGKRSACHWAFVNKLSEYGAIPVPDRFVEDDNGRFMSGGGVTRRHRLRASRCSEAARPPSRRIHAARHRIRPRSAVPCRSSPGCAAGNRRDGR